MVFVLYVNFLKFCEIYSFKSLDKVRIYFKKYIFERLNILYIRWLLDRVRFVVKLLGIVYELRVLYIYELIIVFI